MAPTDTETEFDPAAHNVDEVLDYLDDADDDEVRRVLKAEAAGKGRRTIAEFASAGAAADVAPGEIVAWQHTDPTTNQATGGSGVVVGTTDDGSVLVVPVESLTRIPADALNAALDD